MAKLRAVIDTNVVFEGLTARGGAAGAVIDAWDAKLFQPCISDATANFARLRAELGSASAEEVRKFLDERDPVEPEPEWTPELRERFERQLAKARASSSG